MAWLGTAVSLGFVVGPALGGMLSRTDLHFTARYGHFLIDSFSVPFFAAAFLGLLTLFAAMRWLPESLSAHAPLAAGEEADWRRLARNLAPLLSLALVGQFGLAIFEATFALYAQAKFNYGPVEVGAVFVVCGLVMTVFQVGAVGFLARRLREIYQIGAGFGLMGASLALLVVARTSFSVFAFAGLFALGTAFISPNLAALISKRGGAGASVQRSASKMQPTVSVWQVDRCWGGALFIWQMNAPYLLTGILLVVVSVVIAWNARAQKWCI